MLALLPTGTADLVALGEVSEPSPTPNEALVAVEAFSVIRGELLKLERGGWRPGKDVAGVVVEAAADGSGRGVGSRVVGHPPGGGWAERVAVRTDAMAPAGEVAAETAAALPLAGLRERRVTGNAVLTTGVTT